MPEYSGEEGHADRAAERVVELRIAAKIEGLRSKNSTWTRLQKDSMTAWSKQSPMEPIDGTRADRRYEAPICDIALL